MVPNLSDRNFRNLYENNILGNRLLRKMSNWQRNRSKILSGYIAMAHQLML